MAISSSLVAETKIHQGQEIPPGHKQEYPPSLPSSSAASVEEFYPQELKNDFEANIAQGPSSVPCSSPPTTSGSPPPGPPEQDFGPKVPLTPIRRFLVFLGILMTLFLAALDQTIVTTTLPSIAKDFNNFSDISWVGTAYLLATTCTQPMYGMASDLFGRKRAMLFASGVFLLGSALCGAAQSMTMLIISRAVQGLGGSGIIALTVILVADIVPLRERGNYQALVAVIFSLAAVLGPLLGGVFADKVSWRWAFYINLPIGALAVALLVAFLHMNRRKNVTLAQNLRALDYSGIALLIVAIVMILLGLNWGADAKYPWDSAVILVLLIVGFAVGGLFLWNEVRVAQQPIIPLRLFKSFSLSMTYLDVFIQGFQFLGLLFYLPLYFQAVNGSSPVRSGVELLPFVVVSSAMAVVVGLLMSRWGTYKEFIVSGFATSTVASGLLILFDEDTSKAVVNIVLVLEGIAMGLVVNTTLLGVHAQLANKSDLARSTSLWTFLRTFGGVFGVALGGAFVQSSLSSAEAGEYAQNIRAIAELSPEVRAPVLRAFVVGLQRYFILMTAISGLGFVASLFIVKNKMGAKK
ncbi:hypothetical protein BG006_010107 [Podila minutissima]|uniref:Major facilitator superfamily (MFS) profile domain-containing protein n=1 Tax=Podila minutissima TaxID=64525 RepID=A0A9P5VPU3_9FUNG|nr:hypothetical protein BG006_010107 [Podila minutissima]